MKKMFHINYFITVLFFLPFAKLYSQAQDPFNWTKPVKVEANDVFLQWLQNDGNTVHSYQKIYRYKIDSTFLPTDDLISKTPRHEDDRPQNSVSYTDAASGKFNVSPYDEVVSVWKSPSGINIMIPKFDTASSLWTNTVQDSITGNINRAYVRTADIDGDSLDEFIVAYLTSDDSVHLNLYHVDTASLHPVLLSSYSDTKLVSRQGYNFQFVRYVIATGDFNGDVKDELALFAVEVPPPGGSISSIRVRVKIYDLSGGTFVLKSARNIDVPRLSTFEDFTMAASSGHFTNDNMDELAFTAIRSSEGAYHSYSYILKISQDLKTFTLGKGYEISPPFSSNLYMDLSQASGDLNGDGRDEIVFTDNSKIYVLEPDDSLILSEKMSTDIASGGPDDYKQSNNYIKISNVNQDNNKDIIIVKNFVANQFKNGFYVAFLKVNSTLDSGSLIGRLIGDESNIKNYKSFSIAVGNFDGDNFTIGQPKHYVQNDVVQPVVILNAPPIHFDKFNDSLFDINNCFNGGVCNFTATYVRTVQHTSEVTTTVHKDWELSNGAGISGSAGAGTTINYEAHFLQKYGRHFSKDSANSHKVSVSVTVQAQEDDQIYATVTNFDVWEYPLYNGNETFPRRYVLTVVPNHVEATWYPSKSYNAVHYVPDHEVGNILSYQNYDDPSNNPDLSQTIKAKFSSDYYTLGANGTHNWKLEIDDFRSDNADTVEDNGIDAAVNFVKIASVNYTNTVMSTQTTSIGSNIELSVDLGSVNMGIGDVSYTVKPYAYWSKSGALVVNYAVEPELAPPGFPNTWWQDYYGNNSDPAFILPWRLDPEKGFKLSENAKRFQTKDITFSPSNPNPGDTVTITARVRNFSLIPTPSAVSVKFYIGDPDSGGTPIIGINGTNSVSTIGLIPERGNDDVKLKWVLPSGLPSYPRIYAVLDRENSIHEIHLDNNKGFNVLGAPSITTAVPEVNKIIPGKYTLYQSYPNPFNPATRIDYSISKRSLVDLAVYNILGQKIKTLFYGEETPGKYSVRFNGEGLASGVYFYRLRAGDFVQTRKMILLK